MKRIFAQRRSSRWTNLRLALVTVLLCLLWAEVAGRLLSSGGSIWEHPNYIVRATQPDNEHEAQMRYDAELGHEPVPGFKGTLQDRPISFSTEGLRQHNVGRAAPAGPTILIVGDSFTEGYRVGDDETWPAELERLTDRRVLNGAVRAYGIDQMVLRAERLALVPALAPQTLVLAFIPDDIARTELSIRYNTHKPYFELDSGSLRLANVPVPRTHGELPLWRQVLGYSWLADFVMRRLGLQRVWYGDFERVHHNGDEVSCRLMTRFAQLTQRVGARGLVVALYEDRDWTDAAQAAAHRKRVSAALTCAGKAGLALLDTWDGFAAAKVRDNVAAFYAGQHLTPEGNALAARLVAGALEAGGK